MEDAVVALTESVNANQQFRVVGWFKPSYDDEGVASGHFQYHISSFFPTTPLSTQQNALRYGVAPAEELPSLARPSSSNTQGSRPNNFTPSNRTQNVAAAVDDAPNNAEATGQMVTGPNNEIGIQRTPTGTR